MKKITAILGVLAAVASLSLADSGPEASAKDTKKVVQNNFVETAQKGVKLSGYVDAGYSYNFTGTHRLSSVGSTARTYDNAGNNSSQSTAASATTPACPDTTAPSVPASLTASAGT